MRLRGVLAAPLVLLSIAPSLVDQAPIPRLLKDAKTVYVQNNGLDSRFADRLLKELASWKRFQIVEDLAKADVVFTVSEEQGKEEVSRAPGSAVTNRTTPTSMALLITVGGAGESLWKDTERMGVTTAAAANLAPLPHFIAPLPHCPTNKDSSNQWVRFE